MDLEVMKACATTLFTASCFTEFIPQHCGKGKCLDVHSRNVHMEMDSKDKLNGEKNRSEVLMEVKKKEENL